MKLHFYGGAQTVTGANYLLEAGGKKILVDCGLLQAGSFAENSNAELFPYDVTDIDAVFITHAHIDHTGRLPKLVKDGYRGKIYSTEATKDFAELLLLDSEHVLMIEAERMKKPPIYTAPDVERAISLWEGVPYHKIIDLGGLTVTFYDAGHILGSASILIEAEGKKIVFSGDLGNTPAPIIRPTEYINEADYCLVESTYGGRIHEKPEDRDEILRKTIIETIKNRGVLMIPAFALERTQELLLALEELAENKQIPRVPVFLDSPLAIKLTAVYLKYKNTFTGEAKKHLREGDELFNFPGFRKTLTTDESKSINQVQNPKIIIAGSGMSQGGRILHHERRYLSDPKNTILFIGYQASGSLGRRIVDGAQRVHIFGEEISVRCHVRAIGSYSAHADQPRLLKWVSAMQKTLKTAYIVQGELDQAEALKEKLKENFGVKSVIPADNEVVDL